MLCFLATLDEYFRRVAKLKIAIACCEGEDDRTDGKRETGDEEKKDRETRICSLCVRWRFESILYVRRA